MRLPDGYDVEGWAAIAEVVGASPAHTRARLARLECDPLPHAYLRFRPIANRAELLAWVARQARPRDRPRAADHSGR